MEVEHNLKPSMNAGGMEPDQLSNATTAHSEYNF